MLRPVRVWLFSFSFSSHLFTLSTSGCFHCALLRPVRIWLFLLHSVSLSMTCCFSLRSVLSASDSFHRVVLFLSCRLARVRLFCVLSTCHVCYVSLCCFCVLWLRQHFRTISGWWSLSPFFRPSRQSGAACQHFFRPRPLGVEHLCVHVFEFPIQPTHLLF